MFGGGYLAAPETTTRRRIVSLIHTAPHRLPIQPTDLGINTIFFTLSSPFTRI
jgi:hypothetical protein